MQTQAEYKIIADHLRSSCFLISDGILPSNEGRGYVLRRIMRRAMLQLFKLGTQTPTMYKFVDVLTQQMGQAYPQLIKAKELLVETLKNEEENFRKALKNGLKIIDEEIENLKKTNGKIFDGSIAFKLHDTYGFPLDLTQIILDEKFSAGKITVDQNVFDQEMQKQRQMAKASWKGGGEEALDTEILRLQNQFGETKFTGYDKYEDQAKILYISNNGNEAKQISQDDELKNCFIILDQTPFYATSGGQKGDNGVIEFKDNKIFIKEAKKIGTLFIHSVKSVIGELKQDQEISAKIDKQNRHLRTYNHSATHLMHKALKIILGDSIVQKGSNVDCEYFTFDFNLNRSMTDQELAKVEELVNFYINQNSETKTQEMALDDAIESGAAALFGEKYEDQVRVVSIGEEENGSPYSIELCGGTHVKNTSEIELFKIISEKSIASGIRRIKAVTNVAAKEYLQQELQKIIDEVNNYRTQKQDLEQEIPTFSSKEKFQQIDQANVEDIDAYSQESQLLQQEIKTLTKKRDQLKQNNLLQEIKTEKIGAINFISHVFENISPKDLTQIANNLKSQHQIATATLLFAKNDDKVSALIQISQDLLAKYDASTLIKTVTNDIGAKGGGGKKDFAMTGGNNLDGITSAIETIKKQIK